MTASTSFIPRSPTLSEAEAAFGQACADRHETLWAFVDQEVKGLEAIAAVLATAMRQIAPLFTRLDMALRAHDAQGFAIDRPRFEAEDVDAYALVEALFWDRLTAEAERLLKTLLAAELAR